jgi:eukaryotic-like serine/threonine-protein kinase
MLIPEPPRPREEPEPVVPDSSEESGADGASIGSTTEPATVLRGVSSSARRRLSMPAPAPATPVALPMPGELVDTFLLEESIGVGGMGAVYRALDTKLDRQVALKLLPPDQASDTEVVQRFYQEGRAAARLDHENIARVFSIGQHDLYHYIAFEYIEGLTVRQRVETAGALPVSEAVNIALQIAHALVHASGRSVVHRDIKPSNIIITPQGRAKLVDMGLARRFEREGDRGLTQSGMTLGTFDYISPEQARDPRDVDVRSDLYSLGCTLFHMLTGRPPFPGGTVLQKLIQHQEELPADVRALNPAVPIELANVIAKLMAKNRDRRYQTPEHLVRDLLTVAGAGGFLFMAPDLPDWLNQRHRPSWERHLVWALPFVGFVLVVAGLAWWGRQLSKPSQSRESYSAPLNAHRPSEPGPGALERGMDPTVSATQGEKDATPPSPVLSYPRNIPVNSNEDLWETLASAPRRSVIVLSDDGPYRLGGRNRSHRASAPLANYDLTIKAEAGVRPLLKFAADARLADHPPASLLNFSGGHVTIEGLEFELDTVLPDDLVAAVRTENTELTVRGCSFRRTKSGDGRNVAALHLRTIHPAPMAGDRPAAVFADSCHFDGGQSSVLTEGTADVLLRDCSVGPGQPAFWFDNTRSPSPVAGELRLMHTSVLAGPGPVFRFDGSQVRVWVDDSVIAPAGRSSTNLVMIDNPRNLIWRGRSNLYSNIGVYLALSSRDQRQEQVAEYARWRETPTELRETGTTVSTNPVWAAADPSQALTIEKDNPTRVFLLNPSVAAKMDTGARQGPFGAVIQNVRVAQRPDEEVDDVLPSSPRVASNQVAVPKPPDTPDPKGAAASAPESLAVGPAPAGPATDAAADDPMSLPTMPPMPTAVVAQSGVESTNGSNPDTSPPPNQPRRDEPPRIARETNDPARLNRPPRRTPDDEDVIRSPEQFMSMFNRLGSQGGPLRIGAGVDFELPAIVFEGTGRYELLAEPGPTRPRLRFRPSQVPLRSPADWTVLLSLRSGSLHLQGLDLVIPDPETPRVDRLAAAGLLPGTELTITDCTITGAAKRSASTIFVAQPLPATANSQPSDGATTRSAVIRVRDSFLRSGGGAAIVAAGRGLSLELTNVLVSTEGSLVHAYGGLRAGQADSPTVKVRLDQVTARVKGGLIHLDSTPDEANLPFASVVAENSIVSTANRDDPLFRLDGRDPAEELGDKIRWEASKVAYDRIKTYRRDEVVRLGVSPKIYDRADWNTSFLPKDVSPILGDVKFLRETDSSQVAWKLNRDDLRLAPDSPLANTGPDLSKIPQAPAVDDQ